MRDRTPQQGTVCEPLWVSGAVRAEPRLPLVGPYMAYLVLMMLAGLLPDGTPFHQLGIAAHILAAAWAIRLVRHHWPPLGAMHLGPALVVGLLAAWMWVAGQHALDGIEVAGQSLGGSLSVSVHAPFIRLDPAAAQGAGNLAERFSGAGFWSVVVLKICRAVTVVPIVEELFWRGFILRAFVSWDHYDRVPWGRFTWVAFLGSSLLSVVQHPSNWGVSIVCWMLFNGLFYWKKSLLCLMITHAVTNLALYIYVVGAGDWRFW